MLPVAETDPFSGFYLMSLLPPAVILGWCLHNTWALEKSLIKMKEIKEIQSGVSACIVFVLFCFFFIWQTPHGPRGSMRWMGGTITLCRHGNRWRRTSRAIGSLRRASTTVTCMAPVSRVSARWRSRCAIECTIMQFCRYAYIFQLILANCCCWYWWSISFTSNCRQHQVFPVVKLKYYYAYCYCDGPHADADIQCFQDVYINWAK